MKTHVLAVGGVPQMWHLVFLLACRHASTGSHLSLTRVQSITQYTHHIMALPGQLNDKDKDNQHPYHTIGRPHVYTGWKTASPMHVVFAVLNGLLKRKSKRIELKLINSSGKPTSTNNAVLVLGKLGLEFFCWQIGPQQIGPLGGKLGPGPWKIVNLKSQIQLYK